MRRLGFVGWPVATLAVGLSVVALAPRRAIQVPSPAGSSTALLHNQWRVTPAGVAVELPGDMPGTIVPISGTGLIAVNTCGFHDHSVSLVEVSSHRVVQSIVVPHDWVGMAYDPSRRELFVSGGGEKQKAKKHAKKTSKGDLPADFDGAILRFQFDGQRLIPEAGLDLPLSDSADRFVSGLLSDGHGTLFAANIQTDTVYRLSGPNLDQVKSQRVGYRPYGLAISNPFGRLAVSNWGDKSVTFLDSESLKPISTVPVGPRPNALTFSPDGRLFVALGGSNKVAVISNGKVVENIRTSLAGSEAIGTTPVAVAVAGSRLYVADADENDVAAIDISDPHHTRPIGFIPTGRYPSGVWSNGKNVVIATAKGHNDSSNTTENQRTASKPAGPDQVGLEVQHAYVADLLKGHLNFVSFPSESELRRGTLQVRANRPTSNRAPDDSRKMLNIEANALRKIKHVIYVIRENRTYDQVLGDVKAGNGDARLTLFPQKVTPNSHKLVSDFELFDNIYCDGEVSQVGHQWTDAAYASDYTEKQWILSYSGRQEVDSDRRMFTSPGGYLWQNVRKHGKTSRIYGEYMEWQEDHGSAEGEIKDNPEKFGCSAAFESVFARNGRDPEKTKVFLSEMHQAEKTGVWPNFMVVALNEDHTVGASAGKHTPWSCVGSNDLALGQLVEGVSHSKFWKDTAIFVIQDDAQDGPDHVDAHRTVGLVISPYTRRGGVVNSTMFSTCSMIRTMEIILLLPPMSQYDREATPMTSAFTTHPNFAPWSAVAPLIDINQLNPSNTPLARRSRKLDFSDVDRADPQALNEILWAQIKPGIPMPAPVSGRWR